MTTANTQVAQILLKRGNTVQSSGYVGPIGEVTLDTDLDTLRIHDGSTPGGYSILATKADIDQVNSDIANISLGTIDTAPIIANVREAVLSNITSNINTLTNTIASIDSAVDSVVVDVSSLFANAVTQEGHITTILSNISSLSNSISYLTANAASQETHINEIISDVSNANIAISSLQSNAAIQQGILDTLTGNAVSQSILITSLTSNAASQAEALSELLSNASAQEESLSTLLANAVSQAQQIADLGNSTGNVMFNDTTISVPVDSNIVLQATHNWILSTDGNLVLPTNLDFNASPAIQSSGIVFGDGTLQTTAYTGEEQPIMGRGVVMTGEAAEGQEGSLFYNTVDGRLYVDILNNGTLTWVEASPQIVPANMVGYEDDDSIELRNSLVFPDGSAQTTAYPGPLNLNGANVVVVDSTATGTLGSLWYNLEDGRLYANVGNVWVDASPMVTNENTVTFTDGNIVLPEDGHVTWANGQSILSGISSEAETGRVTFNDNAIIGTTENGFGALRISPNSVDFNNGKWFNIRSGIAEDESHIHLDTGNNSQYDLFLGDDFRYVKNAADGNIYIGTGYGNWSFDYNGLLTTPGSVYINGEGNGLIVDANGDQRVGLIKYAGIEGALVHTSSVPLRIGRISQSNITQANANDLTTEIYLATDGKVGIANVAPSHQLSVSGDIYTSGNIVFSDGTAQTTAYGNTQVASYLETTVKPVTKFTGSWNVLTGSNNYSFTVAGGHTYMMWVTGNVPNGIIVWNATVTVTNTNVPVIGNQYAWYYVTGNALVLNNIPSQIIGTAGAISTASPAVSNTNIFTFGITNNSGSTQTVSYGWSRIS